MLELNTKLIHSDILKRLNAIKKPQKPLTLGSLDRIFWLQITLKNLVWDRTKQTLK